MFFSVDKRAKLHEALKLRPSKAALSGATGQRRPVEARLTGRFVVADPPDNAGAARVSA
jgi:hypothetical protein